MIHGRRSTSHETREETKDASESESLALMPLAVPMLADPGAISTTFIMLNRATNFGEKLSFYFCLLTVILSTFVILRLSVHGSHWLGPLGQKMMARLMGLLLCAVSVQFTINALKQMVVQLKT